MKDFQVSTPTLEFSDFRKLLVLPGSEREIGHLMLHLIGMLLFYAVIVLQILFYWNSEYEIRYLKDPIVSFTSYTAVLLYFLPEYTWPIIQWFCELIFYDIKDWGKKNLRNLKCSFTYTKFNFTTNILL